MEAQFELSAASCRRIKWRNGIAERLIGTIRRECVDHVVALGDRHLRYVLKSYASYYNNWRTHRSLHKDAPADLVHRVTCLNRRTLSPRRPDLSFRHTQLMTSCRCSNIGPRPNRPAFFNTIGHGLPFSPQLAAAVHPNKRPCWTATVAARSGPGAAAGSPIGHTDNRCSFLPIAAIGTKEGADCGQR
jgi:Integrase core domain